VAGFYKKRPPRNSRFEVKQAVKMTALSRHRLRSDRVRLWPSLMR
jgi:hypothetical protein